MSGLTGLASLGNSASGILTAPRPAEPARIRDAAQQFEALLLEQVMQAAKGSGGWLQSDGDSADDCATGLAEQQLAAAMAQHGGLGLSKMIAAALERQAGAANRENPAP